MSRYTIRLLAIALLLTLGGCAPWTKAYRYSGEQVNSPPCVAVNDSDCQQAAVQQRWPGQDKEYYLGFTEFDDQGQALHRQQLNNVLNTYWEVAAQEQLQGRGVILIVFAHGWHHSASNEPQEGCSEDCNIAKFRELLETTAKMENEAKTQRKVLGLYIGWRGDSITLPGLRYLTFWDRKNTAHEVGLQGVTEALVRLEEIVNVANVMQANPLQKSHLVLMGHSFGGAIMFTALQEILADRYYGSRAGKGYAGDAGGFGDLVVLLNPAFEALRFSTLYDISQRGCRNYTQHQTPKFVVLTSESDWATGTTFPIGRSVSTFFETHTDLQRHDCVADASDPNKYLEQPLTIHEGEADRTAIGHYKPYITHHLRSRPISEQAQRQNPGEFKALKNLWARQTPLSHLSFQGSELEHLGKTNPRNPYLNIYVDKALIDGHNDIWEQGIMNFVRELITTTTLPEDTAPNPPQ